MSSRTALGSTPAPLKAQWRERIRQDVAAYLARGGTIRHYTAYDNQGYRLEKLSRTAWLARYKRMSREKGVISA